MTRRILVSAALLLLPVACGSPALTSARSSAGPAHKVKARAKLHAQRHRTARPERGPREVLHAGDTWVHRYSGSFRPRELTLTEKVVSVDGHLAVVHYELADGPRSQHLKVERDLRDDTIRRVWRIEGEQETETGIYAYDEMLGQTAFAADANDGRLSASDETCLVGQKELPCQTTRYHVFVSGEPATLTISASDELPGRDLAGTITDQKGNVLYRAELVDMSRGSDASVASRE